MNLAYKLCILALLFSTAVFGQQASEIIKYSQFHLSGTAASMSINNSAGAMGGDFGAIFQNPASIAVYQKSIFSFSPAMHFNRTKSSSPDAIGSFSGEESNNRFNIDHFGFVFANGMRNNRNFNFAIGLNRTARFDSDMQYSGESLGSIGTHFADLADGFEPGNLDFFAEGLAYETYVIGLPEVGLDYFSDFEDTDITRKSGEISSRGGIQELDFAFGGSINEKVSLGLKLGVPFVSYEEEVLYREENSRAYDVPFKSLEYDQYVNTSGIGFNASFGLIYRPTFPMRIGIAIQTPSWYSLNEDFDSRLYFDYEDDPELFPAPPPQESLSPTGQFEYNINTPWIMRGQFGYILGKRGFLSAEIEYLNYSNSTFGFDDGFTADERILNREVEQQFSDAINIRAGGELVLSNVRLRGGLGLFQNPAHTESNFIPSISGGIGFRADNFFFDAAYRWMANDFNFQPYQRIVPQGAETTVVVDQSNAQLIMTIGFFL